MKISDAILERIDEYCFGCFRHFTKESIDGGRCTACGTMISADSEEEIIKEFFELKSSDQQKIAKEIKRELHYERRSSK